MKIKLKTIFKTTIACLAIVVLGGCDDFFNPENSTVKYGNDYMGEGSELYSGFVGIMTKMQAIGDKAIYLTDTRGELLEPTGNSPELYAIWNYEPDLSGNPYADPAGYYDLIIACNDFMVKARELRHNRPDALDEDHYIALISSAIRLKVWTYFTLGKIYGQAVWFDDPMQELKDYTRYPLLNLDQIIVKCVEYLRTGFDYVDGTHTMSWTGWITNFDDTIDAAEFTIWDQMVPPYWVLAADLAIWQERWQEVIDLVLPRMSEQLASTAIGTSQIKYICNTGYANDNNYRKVFDYAFNNTYTIPNHPLVSVIKYNGLKDQTNELGKHFRADNYMLQPSTVGRERHLDPEFNPNNGGGGNRYDMAFRITRSGSELWWLSKYNKNAVNLYRDDCHIYTYHSIELYFMLVEALNHLGRYEEMEALINQGVGAAFPRGGALCHWDGFEQWGEACPLGNRAFPDLGIRGCFGLPSREMQPCDSYENIRENDLSILKEIVLTQTAEGKTYSAMIRMARRYNDLDIITDLVCPKYEEAGKASEIESKIKSKNLTGTEGYFVPWDLSTVSSTH